MEQVAPYHPDVLKIFTDGWRYGSAPDMTSMDQATLNMLVDEARRRNIRVLTHTGWKKVRIPFSQFKQPKAMPSLPGSGNDLMALSFQIPGTPGSRRWLELDNIRFYREAQAAEGH